MNARIRFTIAKFVAVWAMFCVGLFLLAALEQPYGVVSSLKDYILKAGVFYTIVFAIVLVAGVSVMLLTSKSRIARKLVAWTIAMISLFALVAPETTQWYGNYFQHDRIRERRAILLQRELNRDEELHQIRLKYWYYPYSKGSYLHVAGDIPTQEKYNNLVKRIVNADDWSIDWNVTIDGQDP